MSTTPLTRLIRPPQDHRWSGDIARIKEALNAAGYDASAADIEWAWDEYSDSMAAGWLSLPYDIADSVGVVRRYLMEESQ